MSQVLPAGTPVHRRRALMGLLDADGWGWASLKAFLWFGLIVVMIGYIPDRAYYFTVNRTLDVGLLAWSPVNFCPPENKTLPCPAPLGSVIPWDPSPAEVALPGPRLGGSVAQIGTKLLYIGGSDGTAATDTTFISDVASGNYGAWTTGPKLPEARADAAVVSIGSTIYLIGGAGPDGKPVDTIWTLTYDQTAKTFGDWQSVDGLALPGGSRRRVGDPRVRRPRRRRRHRPRRLGQGDRLEGLARREGCPREVRGAVATAGPGGARHDGPGR